MVDLVRFCVLYVYSIVVFNVYMYSVSAQGIVGHIINARYYYYYYTETEPVNHFDDIYQGKTQFI